jgi:hypothetical protein
VFSRAVEILVKIEMKNGGSIMALVPFGRKTVNPLGRLHNEVDDLFDGFF